MLYTGQSCCAYRRATRPWRSTSGQCPFHPNSPRRSTRRPLTTAPPSALWLADTAAHRLRLESGRRAIAEWEHDHGPLTADELADGLARARALLGRAKTKRPSRRSA